VRTLLLILGIAASAAGFSGASRAGPPVENVARGPGNEEIVVTGSRHPHDPIAAFVEAITVDTDDQIAQFSERACPLSLGLAPGQNHFIEARIRQIAEHLGIGSGREGCSPNVVVIVAENGAGFVERLRHERPSLFSALELGDIRAIDRLAGPVRTWQVVEPRGADGRPMERISFIQTSPNEPPRFIPRGYMLAGVMPSLTQRSTRQAIAMSFIVFDLEAVEGLNLLQIADHASMRALARTDPTGLPPQRSILTLFVDREGGSIGAPELTSWDAAYLRAIYGTRNVLTAHQQRANLVRTMRRDLESPQVH